MKRLVFAGLVLGLALPAAAQDLKLTVKDGRATLEADRISLRRILAEWERVGGTRIFGADSMRDGLLTLRLVEMPERDALDVILHDAAGYIAISRGQEVDRGASVYGRVWILAASTTPASTAQSAVPVSPPVASIPADAPNVAGERPADVPVATMSFEPPLELSGIEMPTGRRGAPGSRPPSESMLAPPVAPAAPVAFQARPGLPKQQ